MTMNTLELEQELPRRERRKLVTPTATIAAAITIAALGFAAGVEVQKSQGAEASPGRMAFLSRSSTGSMPSFAASSSICDSPAKVACGLPKPRNEPARSLLVYTASPCARALAMR